MNRAWRYFWEGINFESTGFNGWLARFFEDFEERGNWKKDIASRKNHITRVSLIFKTVDNDIISSNLGILFLKATEKRKM